MKTLLALCGVALMLQSTFAQSVPTPSATSHENGSDQTFWFEANQILTAQVRQGQLAAKVGTSPFTRGFGQLLADANSKGAGEFLKLAAKERTMMPTLINGKYTMAFIKLSKLKGAAFDDGFKKQELADHKEAVKLFSDESKNGGNPDLRAFATKYLAVFVENQEILLGKKPLPAPVLKAPAGGNG